MTDPVALLHAGLTICRTGIDGHEAVMGGLFLTGLVGSLSHCAGMCGPFVLAQAAARMQAVPLDGMSEWRRLAGAALLPYHLGRATTYGALGALAGAASGAMQGIAGFRLLAAGLLALGAGLLVAMAVPGLKGTAPGQGGWAERIGRLARPLFATPFGVRGWVLGIALGFIPCGLLYAALAAAAATGSAVAGAMAMLAFSAGTAPMLLLVGSVGHAALGRWRGLAPRVAPLLLAMNAMVLGFLAWQVSGL